MRDIFDTGSNPPYPDECFTSPIGVVEFRLVRDFDLDSRITCDRCVLHNTETCQNGAVCCTWRNWEGYYRKANK